MTDLDRLRTEQALTWLRRIHEPDFIDWEAHVAWLEADDRNLEAFDRVSLLFDEATTGLAPAGAKPTSTRSPINDNPDRPLTKSAWHAWQFALGGAIAASIAAVIAIPTVMHEAAQPLIFQTRAGEHRSLTLQDGTRLALNGDTRVRIAGIHQRQAILDKGEAYFAVHHDAADPFTVEAGTAKFQDAGTAFDVVVDKGQTRLAVRAGTVLYNPGTENIRLTAGQAIRIADGSSTIEAAPLTQVGGWRNGKLSYRQAPLSEIADDLTRTIGDPVTVGPDLADRRYTGVIVVVPDHDMMFRGMASVLGVSIRRKDAGWRIAKH